MSHFWPIAEALVAHVFGTGMADLAATSSPETVPLEPTSPTRSEGGSSVSVGPSSPQPSSPPDVGGVPAAGAGSPTAEQRRADLLKDTGNKLFTGTRPGGDGRQNMWMTDGRLPSSCRWPLSGRP